VHLGRPSLNSLITLLKRLGCHVSDGVRKLSVELWEVLDPAKLTPESSGLHCLVRSQGLREAIRRLASLTGVENPPGFKLRGRYS